MSALCWPWVVKWLLSRGCWLRGTARRVAASRCTAAWCAWVIWPGGHGSAMCEEGGVTSIGQMMEQQRKTQCSPHGFCAVWQPGARWTVCLGVVHMFRRHVAVLVKRGAAICCALLNRFIDNSPGSTQGACVGSCSLLPVTNRYVVA